VTELYQPYGYRATSTVPTTKVMMGLISLVVSVHPLQAAVKPQPHVSRDSHLKEINFVFLFVFNSTE